MFLARIILFLLLSVLPSWGQTSGGFITGQTLTATQLNAAFASKQDFTSLFLTAPPFTTFCNPTGTTTTPSMPPQWCAALTAAAPLQVASNVLSIAGLAGGVLAGSGPAFTVTPLITGPVSIGPSAPSGMTPGDLSVTRSATPTQGLIFFGNSGSQYLFFDGTGFNFTGGFSAQNLVSSVGTTSGFVIANRATNATVATLYSSAGEFSVFLSGFGGNILSINGTTGLATFAAPVAATTHISTAAAATVAAGQIGYGGTTVAAGSGTCPTGTVGGQTVQGCIVMNIAGTNRNVPFF